MKIGLLRKHLWAITLLPASLLVTFFPVLFGSKVLLPSDMIDIMTLPYSASYHTYDIQNHYVNDAMLQFYPYKSITKKGWEAGKSAYWNPNILCGYPESSETFVSYYDPFNLILLFGDMPGSYHWQIVLQLLWAGIGMYVFLLARKISPRTSAFFAALYMLNGMFIGQLLYRWMVGSMCWLPWILVYIYNLEGETPGKKRRIFTALAIVSLAAAMAGGTVQTSAFLVLIVATVILFEHIGTKQFWPALGRTAEITVGAGLLSAIMWLPVLELLAQVFLNGGTLHSTSVFASYSIVNRLWTIPLLFTFFMPQLAGGPISILKLANAYAIDFSGSIAFIPLIAGLWGLVRFRKEKGLRVYSFLAIAAIVLPVATPLFSFLYHRFFIVFFFSMLVLGAHAVDTWISNVSYKASLRKWFRFSIIGYTVFVGALLALNIIVGSNKEKYLEKLQSFTMSTMESAKPGNAFYGWMESRTKEVFTYFSLLHHTMYLPLALIGLSLFFFFLFIRSKGQKRELFSSGFLLVSLFQLIVAAWWWLPMVDPSVYPLYPKTEETDMILRDPDKARIYSPSAPPKEKFIFVNNVNNMYGIADVRGFESLVPRSYATFQEHWRKPDTLNARLLGLFHAGFVLTATEPIADSSFESISNHAVKLYRNKLLMPRAFMSYQWQYVSSDSDAIRLMQEPSFDGATALLQSPVGIVPSQPDSGSSDAKIVTSDENSLHIHVSTNKAGILILSDTYYPGWKCKVNGKETEILRANYCMRAVVVPAGSSEIVFSYEPMSVKVGLWITLGSITFLIVFIFRGTTRKNS